MLNIEHGKARLLATKNAQALILALWLWAEKTLQQWTDDIAAVDQLENEEHLKRTEWRNAAIVWDADLTRIQAITRALVRKCRYKYRNTPDKKKLFAGLRTDGRSRAAIYDQGNLARGAWQTADAMLTVRVNPEDANEVSQGELGSLLASAQARNGTHGLKLGTWRMAAAAFMAKLASADVDAIAWYEEATRKFGPATPQGQTIRSTIPTATRPVSAVGAATLQEPMVSGRMIHLHAAAAHATKFTFFHKAPGSPVFLVLVTESEEASFTLNDAAPGVHEFKAQGINSRGEGTESAVVQATIAQENAA